MPKTCARRLQHHREWAKANRAKINIKEVAWHNKRPLYMAVKRARMTAAKTGVPFALDDRKIFQPTHCPVLGLELRYGQGKGLVQDNSASLDRIRPERGYVSTNVRVISHRANTIKSNATAAELRAVAIDLEKLLTGSPPTD